MIQKQKEMFLEQTQPKIFQTIPDIEKLKEYNSENTNALFKQMFSFLQDQTKSKSSSDANKEHLALKLME